MKCKRARNNLKHAIKAGFDSKSKHIWREFSNSEFLEEVIDCGYTHRSDELNQLRSMLLTRVKQLAQQHLTEVQLKYFNARAAGATIKQIAEQYDVNYLTVYNALMPQRSVTRFGIRYYGGAYRKLAKITQTDDICQQIVAEIRNYSDGGEYDQFGR